MNPLDTLLSMQPSALPAATVVQGLLLAAGLGLAVAVTWRLCQREAPETANLPLTFILLAQTAALVMMVIGNSLARAFSLVGALAIVRFRARISNPLDIGFVFLALAVGIGTGVLAWATSALGTAVVCLAVLALGSFSSLGAREQLRLVRCDVASYEGIESAVDAVIARHSHRRTLDQAVSLRFGEMFSYRYRASLLDASKTEALIRELSQIEGVERVIVSQIQDASGD